MFVIHQISFFILSVVRLLYFTFPDKYINKSFVKVKLPKQFPYTHNAKKSFFLNVVLISLVWLA